MKLLLAMSSLRVSGVASKEVNREQFNSCLPHEVPALDEVFQNAVKADPKYDEEINETMREYINVMSMELYEQKLYNIMICKIKIVLFNIQHPFIFTHFPELRDHIF